MIKLEYTEKEPRIYEMLGELTEHVAELIGLGSNSMQLTLSRKGQDWEVQIAAQGVDERVHEFNDEIRLEQSASPDAMIVDTLYPRDRDGR